MCNLITSAESGNNEALLVAQRQSAKLFELRAAMSMAWLWCDQGKRDEARELLARQMSSAAPSTYNASICPAISLALS